MRLCFFAILSFQLFSYSPSNRGCLEPTTSSWRSAFHVERLAYAMMWLSALAGSTTFWVTLGELFSTFSIPFVGRNRRAVRCIDFIRRSSLAPSNAAWHSYGGRLHWIIKFSRGCDVCRETVVVCGSHFRFHGTYPLVSAWKRTARRGFGRCLTGGNQVHASCFHRTTSPQKMQKITRHITDQFLWIRQL